ncbi:MAG: IS110 family transposase [Alphaproteobacteria bacterium]
MKQYAGLDVSMKETSVWVLDEAGGSVFRGNVSSTPEAIAGLLRRKAPGLARVVLEAGPLSTWHWHGLVALGVPVVCVDARHARAALSMRVNKTDANDAEGLAQLARSGWYREVRVKSVASHCDRSVLAARAQLMKTLRALENQMRGLLKTFGLLVGKVGKKRFETRVRTLIADQPMLAGVFEPLLVVRAVTCRELDAMTRRVVALARVNPGARILMRMPGIGSITALAYVSTIDDPRRFARSADAGAYLGLTPRRYQSGEVDRSGHISKCGDRMTRSLLYEAANVLLTRVKRPSALRAWGLRLAKRAGAKKAKVALARKMAAILHRMWMDDADFRWSGKQMEAKAA